MSANGPYVYVIKDNLKAELRPVTLGQQQDDLVVIEKGLQPGERVVINGQMAVSPDGSVKINEPNTTANPPAGTGGKS